MPEDAWEPVRENPAPFRRCLTKTKRKILPISPIRLAATTRPLPQDPRRPSDFPITIPLTIEGPTSSIQFPVSSPDHQHGFDSPRPSSTIRSRFNSYGDFDTAYAFHQEYIRVHSRLDNISLAEDPGWRAWGRESTA